MATGSPAQALVLCALTMLSFIAHQGCIREEPELQGFGSLQLAESQPQNLEPPDSQSRTDSVQQPQLPQGLGLLPTALHGQELSLA